MNLRQSAGKDLNNVGLEEAILNRVGNTTSKQQSFCFRSYCHQCPDQAAVFLPIMLYTLTIGKRDKPLLAVAKRGDLYLF